MKKGDFVRWHSTNWFYKIIEELHPCHLRVVRCAHLSINNEWTINNGYPVSFNKDSFIKCSEQQSHIIKLLMAGNQNVYRANR